MIPEDYYLQSGKTKLVRRTQGNLGQLHDVRKGDRVQSVLSSVQKLAGVLKSSLRDQGGRIASAARRGVVGARIAALGGHGGKFCVLEWILSARVSFLLILIL